MVGGYAVGVLLVLLVGLSGAGWLAGLPGGHAQAVAPPQLVEPAAGATLPQDNLWDECTIYGLGWVFAWRGVGDGARYELEVERVGILINGRTVESLNGHLDLRRPLAADWSLVVGAGQPS